MEFGPNPCQVQLMISGPHLAHTTFGIATTNLVLLVDIDSFKTLSLDPDNRTDMYHLRQSLLHCND